MVRIEDVTAERAKEKRERIDVGGLAREAFGEACKVIKTSEGMGVR
jgi:hypothetical protein